MKSIGLIILVLFLMRLIPSLKANFCGINNRFNHLLLALQWPTTFVEYNRRPRRDNIRTLREHREKYGYLFTIHGLWPQSDHGYGPNNCNHSDSFNINSVSQIAMIDKYWTSFGMPTTNFWRYLLA